MMRLFIPMFTTLFLFICFSAHAESQGNDYKGVTDPFGDPANYEFAEDEKEDKEFFHLGRYLMLGVDMGVGIFTGGLGRTTTPGFNIGGKLSYFFDKSFGIEAAVHYSNHTDTVVATNGDTAIVDTNLIPITLGFRYYFDVKNAPRAIAVANPYLVLAGGLYIRSQEVIDNSPGFTFLDYSSSTNSFGGAFGGGAEFNVYRKHIYLGADFRYHMIFFSDEDATYKGRVTQGDRGGDYFSAVLTITYNY